MAFVCLCLRPLRTTDHSSRHHLPALELYMVHWHEYGGFVSMYDLIEWTTVEIDCVQGGHFLVHHVK